MKKIKIIYLLICHAVFTIATKAQDVLLPTDLSSDQNPYEFSSLTTFHSDTKEFVILAPTLKGIKYDKSKCLYAIPSTEVKASLLSGKQTTFLSVSIDSTSYQDFIGTIKNYDGIEGTIIVGNDVYFSIEANGKKCYVVKGTISKKNDIDFSITLNGKCNVKKPVASDNDGFEGITYDKTQNKLIVVFEKGHKQKLTKAYSINLTLTEIKDYLFPEIEYRLPDITSIGDDKFVFISSNKNYSPYLIQLNKDKTINKFKTSFNPTLNWEGITTFNKGDEKNDEIGFLLINDNCNCKFDPSCNCSEGKIDITKLSYIKLQIKTNSEN